MKTPYIFKAKYIITYLILFSCSTTKKSLNDVISKKQCSFVDKFNINENNFYIRKNQFSQLFKKCNFKEVGVSYEKKNTLLVYEVKKKKDTLLYYSIYPNTGERLDWKEYNNLIEKVDLIYAYSIPYVEDFDTNEIIRTLIKKIAMGEELPSNLSDIEYKIDITDLDLKYKKISKKHFSLKYKTEEGYFIFDTVDKSNLKID